MIEYQITTQQEWIDRVRTKFRVPMDQLKLLGFVELVFYHETVPWLGISMDPMGFLGAFTILSNEVSRLGSRLSVISFHIVMISREYSTYAFVFNMGINFYTSFTDGTCLVSSNFMGIEINDDVQKLYKIATPRSIQTAWMDHLQLVNKFRSEGKQERDVIGFADYIELVKRVDEYTLKHRDRINSGGSATGPSFITNTTSLSLSIIVSMGIIVGCVFTLTFLGNAVGSFYPACWFVRNLRTTPLLLNFLAIPACLGLSWFLARFPNYPFTIDGIGTRFYGNIPEANSQGYISTKWLVLPGIPLIPVRSYLVFDAPTSSWNRKFYTMQPLRKVNLAQVKETISKLKVRYGVLVLILTGFTVWAIFECS